MRIPTSVIVMTLVTAAPFALAVRDTLHPQPKHHAYEDELDVSQEAETARYEAEMQRMEAERQADAARRQAVFKSLLGDTGKLGAYLDYVTIGATRDQISAIDDRIQSASDIMYLVADYDANDTAKSIKVVVTECSELGEIVRSQWGEGNQWIDTAAHVKTTFDDGFDCSIEQHRYVEMDRFLAGTLTASIPLAALHKPASQLPLDDDGTMKTLGIAHTGEPVVRATIDDNGKIAGLSVTFDADVEADAPIRARLDQLLGTGKQDPDTGEWSWTKIPVHYTFTDAHIYIDIGEP